MNLRLVRELQDSCTLVPNRRYARVLEESYNHWQVAHDQRTWARPAISSTSSFLLHEGERLFISSAPELRILSSAMQRAAFLSLAPEGLRGAHNWYPDIARAWDLSYHYALENPEDAHLETSNTLLFQVWAKAFQEFAKAHGYVTECELPDLLTKGLEAGHWIPERRILLWGFSQAHPLTPSESKLLEQLRQRKLVTDWPAPARVRAPKTPRIVEFEQPEDELRTIALWARGLLENAQAPVSIGIAFPDLRQRRHQVERQLFNTLYPAGEANADEPRLFDIAGGIPLTRISVCESALLLLNFLYKEISIEDLERLLESPFLRLDVPPSISNELRRRLPGRIRARDFDANSQGVLPDSLLAFSNSRRRQRSLSAWLAEFRKALEVAGWPQAQTLDSLTYQHATRLVGVFNEVGCCSTYLHRMSAADAVSEFIRAADDKHHEVQRSGAPIRVLDIEELVNLRFTHLWVAGMRNAEWPASTNPNPFVSRLSQRKVNVPGVTPESRLRRARFISQALLGIAREVVFSHAQYDGDELHRPSALLPPAIQTQPGFFVTQERHRLLRLSHPHLLHTPISPELFLDEAAPACGPSERQGNAELVRDQSNCPFLAFARHRLGIVQPSGPTDLPDARAMGDAAHLALEIAYRELPSQESIKQHPNLRSLANRSAQQAVQELMSKLPAVVRTSTKRMLAELLKAWFACDRERPAYAHLHTEQEIELELEDMLLRLKIDRFDQDLETGKCVITDYKSTPPSPTSLRVHATLHEPQLLLYAEALRETKGIEPVSLAFGALGGPSEARYRHCSADARFRRQAADREQDALVLDNSGQVVRRLIREYLDGHASVSPRKGACETCHLQSLCRIHSLDYM